MASSSTNLEILSKAALPSLIQSLDASDVLEVYHLERHAALDVDFLPTNATSQIVVPKSALGLRYNGNNNKNHKACLELTLEYGPQRIGSREATLQVGENTVTWQNQAHVYYSTTFSPQEWTQAHYMASMTGAVLPKVLEQSVVYAEKRRRYQPFVVLREEKILLKSSTSSDYLQHIWTLLATFGVQVRPMLPPTISQAQLHVSEIQRVASGDILAEFQNTSVSQQALHIYGKLQSCLAAIATGDYSAFDNTTTTTPSQAPSISPTNTSFPTTSEINDDENKEEEENGHDDQVEDDADDTNEIKNEEEEENGNDQVDDDVDDTAGNDDAVENNDREEPPIRRLRWLQEDDELVEDEFVPEESPIVDSADHTNDDESLSTSTAVPSMTPTVSVNQAEEANKAAHEAMNKAHEAKEAAHSQADNKAADAAEAAATAAQKAADVTSHKQQQISQTNLLSGNGELMTASVVTCFTNPRYQLANDDQDGSVLFYLYVDGATYYRLNLTMPYLDVATVDRPIPLPPLEAGSGGGDFVDWTLLCIFLAFLSVGIVLVIQRIGFKFLFPPLYKSQKWFFSPTSSGYDSEEEEANLQMGQGFEHAFGEDVIPFSMGGRRPHVQNPAALRKRQVGGVSTNNNTSDLYVESTNGRHESHGDVEMVVDPLSSPVAMHGRSDSLSSGGGARLKSGPIIMDLPDRLARDPDLVDLPNLSSRSKVAVPVAIEHQRSHDSRKSSDDEGGYASSGDDGSEGSFTY